MKKLLIAIILVTTCLQAEEQKTDRTSIYGTTSAKHSIIYPLALAQGLIRISTTTRPHSVNIYIKRHTLNTVIVKGYVDKDIHVPWKDDVIKGLSAYAKTYTNKKKEMVTEQKINDKVRCGNRLSLVLDAEGTYEITIPYDADIDAELTTHGTLSYASNEPTQLHVDYIQLTKDNETHIAPKIRGTIVPSNKLEPQTFSSDLDKHHLPITKLKSLSGDIVVKTTDAK